MERRLHKIINADLIGFSTLRQAVLAIADEGLRAIDTTDIVKKHVLRNGNTIDIAGEKFAIENSRRLFIIGIGKCSLEAGEALEAILGDLITDGIIVDVHEGSLSKLRTFTGTHPFPSEQNIDATKEIIRLLSGVTKDDVVVMLISGGGSVLLCQPSNFTCNDETEITKHLFMSGADIQELNTIRKHLSKARGGFLAQHAYPARVVSLVFSDVPGDNLQYIASGPTVLDRTTINDALEILHKYGLTSRPNFSVDWLMETPKDEKYFLNVKNVIVVSNKDALDAMLAAARDLGYSANVVTSLLRGEAREVGIHIMNDLLAAKSRSVMIYGGETTVNVRGAGRGGRNLELCLSAVSVVRTGVLIMSFDSDGRDNCEYAGAICDVTTQDNAKARSLDPEAALESNGSYDFFTQTGDFVLTGDTGSNVSDLVIAIRE